jgi:diadenosine tetraphosphate (Ap4A) HIT family hydrolase
MSCTDKVRHICNDHAVQVSNEKSLARTAQARNELMQVQKVFLQKSDSTIGGFNIGMNCGEISGQSVWHCHVHLIPRRKNDVEYPKCGVRHIIAGKGFYEDLR